MTKESLFMGDHDKQQKLSSQTFSQMQTRFDSEQGVAWLFMNPHPRPCYSFELLEELHLYEEAIASLGGRISHENSFSQINYYVLASKVPGVYNLGGDLAHFKELITLGDRETLMRYARLCIAIQWNRVRHFNAPITTLALIQGQALGGGFEGAMPADVIIAERSAIFGLPEIIFNLFPGMGALSLLSRKVGMRTAEKLIYSGKLYTAVQMAEQGVVDVVCEDGGGEKAIYDWVRSNKRMEHAFRTVQRAKALVNPVTFEELMGVAEVWVAAALSLKARDLKMMERLVAAQNRKTATAQRSVE